MRATDEPRGTPPRAANRPPPRPATAPSGREPPPRASRGKHRPPPARDRPIRPGAAAARHARQPPSRPALAARRVPSGTRPAPRRPDHQTFALHQPAFLAPFGRSKRSLTVLRHRAWGTEGKRVPCGHLPPKVAKRPEGGERNERWARPAPSAKIGDRESAPNPGRRGGKRVPCGHLGRRPKATRSAPEGSVSPVGCCRQRRQSDPQA